MVVVVTETVLAVEALVVTKVIATNSLKKLSTLLGAPPRTYPNTYKFP
jgi:hypothetical protein